ncbi:hypothetical protein J2T09_003758 [Neorhizobium huautlense]|uniref:Uncharacterized protein n=1 Tax=Neorhizobium huautlense TaxID=67774 RepID=A0ABT9PXZ4_9HYPH|nr:hypothetical protein [Neorhizobium huautlense]MDP9838986.1 hypothetical protein [Neorhizobium huautlense]
MLPRSPVLADMVIEAMRKARAAVKLWLMFVTPPWACGQAANASQASARDGASGRQIGRVAGAAVPVASSGFSSTLASALSRKTGDTGQRACRAAGRVCPVIDGQDEGAAAKADAAP